MWKEIKEIKKQNDSHDRAYQTFGEIPTLMLIFLLILLTVLLQQLGTVTYIL